MNTPGMRPPLSTGVTWESPEGGVGRPHQHHPTGEGPGVETAGQHVGRGPVGGRRPGTEAEGGGVVDLEPGPTVGGDESSPDLHPVAPQDDRTVQLLQPGERDQGQGGDDRPVRAFDGQGERSDDGVGLVGGDVHMAHRRRRRDRLRRPGEDLGPQEAHRSGAHQLGGRGHDRVGSGPQGGGQLVVARSGGGVEDIEDDHAGAGGREAADEVGLRGPGPRPGGGRLQDGAGVDADNGHPRVELVGREEGVGRLALEAGEDRPLQAGPAGGGDEGGDEHGRLPAGDRRPPTGRRPRGGPAMRSSHAGGRGR